MVTQQVSQTQSACNGNLSPTVNKWRRKHCSGQTRPASDQIFCSWSNNGRRSQLCFLFQTSKRGELGGGGEGEGGCVDVGVFLLLCEETVDLCSLDYTILLLLFREGKGGLGTEREKRDRHRQTEKERERERKREREHRCHCNVFFFFFF